MEFRPAAPTAPAKRSQAAAVRTARKAAGPSARQTDVSAQFAEFDAPIGAWLDNSADGVGRGATDGTEARRVWVVVFPAVVGQRSTGVVRRAHVSTPPTTSRTVVTDVRVVIDDKSGDVIVRSEYSAAQ